METGIIIIAIVAIFLIVGAMTEISNRKKEQRRASLKDTQELLNELNYGLSYYDSKTVKVLVKQILESVYILENSTNVETIETRYVFLKEKISDLNLYKKGKIYYSDMISALTTYENNYYNRITTAEQKNFIEAYDYDHSDYLYKTALIRSAVECYRKNASEILTLKQKQAIEKRKALILSTCSDIRAKLIAISTESEIKSMYQIFDVIEKFVLENKFEEELNVGFNKI